jgi:hypothetical protein
MNEEEGESVLLKNRAHIIRGKVKKISSQMSSSRGEEVMVGAF